MSTADHHTTPSAEELDGLWERVIGRRAFLKGAGVAGAAALPVAGALTAGTAFGAGDRITKGDVAILRFLAAAEIIESDLWQQYNELGGAKGGNAAYMAALSNLDDDMPQYIADNTDDEISHERFLNAYLRSKGASPVDLDHFRTLPSTKATGARQVGRLTNLQRLDVDTSWYLRYRSGRNPDLGASFGQAQTIKGEPAIPLDDAETPPNTDQPNPPTTRAATRMQAIANTAAYHFAFIEQGGSSLYTTMALKASSAEVLRVVVSIGGVEVNHFAIWHDTVGDAVAPLTDPVTSVRFRDLNAPPLGGERFSTNLIMPEPTEFLRRGLPAVSVIRPSSTRNAGAMATIRAFTDDGLFAGQSREFFRTVKRLAEDADAAQRRLH